MSRFMIVAGVVTVAALLISANARAQEAEHRIVVAPTNPPSVGVAVVVMGRRCATCGWRPLPGVTIELRGPTRADSAVLATATATSAENGVAHVVFETSPDSLLYSPGPITVRADGGPEVDVTDRFQVAAAPARGLAAEQEAARPSAPRMWDGELAGIAIAGQTRRQVARACAAAGLRWERRAQGDFQCAGIAAPVPRHILGHRDASIVVTFGEGDRVETASLNLPFGNSGDSQREASRLIVEAQRDLGRPAESTGNGLSRRTIWRVRDVEGARWRVLVGFHLGNAIWAYARDREPDEEPFEGAAGPDDPDLERPTREAADR